MTYELQTDGANEKKAIQLMKWPTVNRVPGRVFRLTPYLQYKSLPFASHLTPGVCIADSMPSQSLPYLFTCLGSSAVTSGAQHGAGALMGTGTDPALVYFMNAGILFWVLIFALCCCSSGCPLSGGTQEQLRTAAPCPKTLYGHTAVA